MQDDIRPQSDVPPAPKKASSESATTGEGSVDELKLVEEFGPPIDNPEAPPAPTAKERIKKLLPKVKPRNGHKRELILLVVAIVILAGAAVASFMILQRQPSTLSGIFMIHQKPFVPKTVASRMTGLQVDPSVNDRTVTAVMIENSIDARPQSGLDQADIVFEALAEGGITRFMALFQDSQPDYLGPVRSARPYYIQWLLGFDSAYAHVGGSPDALSDITAWHVKDLNQFYNSSYYQRISSRYAPHNVYTSIAQLNAAESSKGYGKSNYTGFVHKKKATPLDKPTASTINVKMSGFYYDSQYIYDKTTNTYKRSQAGAAHMQLHKDGSQAQIAPTVIVAMIVPEHSDSAGHYAIYSSIGTGQVLVFQDGGVQTGTWTKTTNESQISLKDAAGKDLALDPGRAWVVAVPSSASNVTYQ